MTNIANYAVQNELESELERLKRILKLGYELKVMWIPKNDSKLAGEVRGDHIYIYDEDVEVALETLKHGLSITQSAKSLNHTRK